ncbi:uncharacterized protein B0H18DRAFT_1197137 [Fomitopsis serialis]|uniref:uncharacterized protein n=1 Tax=Fomitopsis serialis TaxID=139415 RepID=UPI002008D812|nr:uncharacterized protein B0H18DRAFT_1197137 [Neoantrodia serialis]KAH9919237.1 hypothetical protein B0H18DRAFT_1197137 [Neoantrodia serialis]
MKFSAALALSLATATMALPRHILSRDSGFALQNGQQAMAQNAQFASLTADSSCTTGTDMACVNNSFTQCLAGKWILTNPCSCAALPLVNSQGTSITCTTQNDLQQRIAATGASSSSNSTSSATSSVAASATGGAATSVSVLAAPSSTATGSGNDTAAQSSLTLLDSLINTGFSSESGEIASITSSNNFINYCSTVNLPLTNGTQVKAGSCNAAPMGAIAATTAMPSAKFVYPPNLGSVLANTNFTVVLAIRNLETGWSVNPNTNYFAASQQVNASTGLIHEAITSMNQTDPTDPTKFAFFSGLNAVAENGQLSTTGLWKGTYRMASINAAANHQAVLVAVAQHGSLDDMV